MIKRRLTFPFFLPTNISEFVKNIFFSILLLCVSNETFRCGENAVSAQLPKIIYIHWKLFSSFHPFYSLFLLTVLSTNTIIYILTIAHSIFKIVNSSSAILLIYYIISAVEVYSQAMMFCCVLERVCATVFRKNYEYSRFWKLAVLSQPLAFLYLAPLYLLSTLDQLAIRLIVYILTSLLLILVLGCNCHITLKLIGSGASLSTRYQVIENIRTLRMILPIALVQICTFFIGNNFIAILDSLFPKFCLNDVEYVNIIRVFIFFVISLVIPCAIGMSHNAYRKYMLPLRFQRSRRLVFSQHQVSLSVASNIGPREKKLPKVVNVLGIEISSVGEQMYFENLSKAWNLTKF
ncbi:unnamed protein product [Auanema sp. JU1783]|nr:unnamed protein product [Auanema sp. JU1783]